MPNDQQRCDVCASELHVAFPEVRDPQTGHVFSILRCSECGLGHTRPQPDDLGEYYGSEYYGGRHGITEKLCATRRLRFVKAVTRPSRVLDFGCGDGGFLEAALKMGWHAVGVEMQPTHARSKGLTVVERIEDTTGSFDLITLWHSLEHVRSPRDALGALLQRLADGGILIVAVPNNESLQAQVFGSSWFHLDVPRHLFHFTPFALRRLLENHGMQIVRRWNLESELDLFGWTQSALNRIIYNPNVLFDVLTRRRRRHKLSEIGASVVLGTAATIAAAPMVPLAAAISRGAVVTFAAKKQGVTP
jgi:SAM-dependent methyltransferase